VQYILNTSKNINDIYTSKNIDNIYYCIIGSDAGNLLRTSIIGGSIPGLLIPHFGLYIYDDVFSALSFGIIGTISFGIGTIGFFKYLMIRQINKILLKPDLIIKIINSDNRYYEYVGYYVSQGIILGSFVFMKIVLGSFVFMKIIFTDEF